MSTSPDQDHLHERASDDLASLALGEPLDPELTDHVAGCPRCQADLAAYREVVQLAKVGGRAADDDVPPPSVWASIEAAVRPAEPPTSAASATSAAPPPVVPLAAARRRPVRRALLAAAAVVGVLGAGAGGWALGHDSSSGAGTTTRAALQAQPGTSDSAHGVAAIRSSRDGYQLVVQTYDLPARSGYYEVWMYDPDAGQMVAVGALGTGGRGTFTLPGGMDLKAYHVVDVSAQRYNGNPAHDRSVLRGPLDG